MGDAGWGRLVANNKYAGYFSDELVEAMAEMIQNRWKPTPAPQWVCCVPSRNHPELVPSFARRLASRLGLPFVNSVSKIKDNQPQKVSKIVSTSARIWMAHLLLQNYYVGSPYFWSMTLWTPAGR